jgi:hypothetical protein
MGDGRAGSDLDSLVPVLLPAIKILLTHACACLEGGGGRAGVGPGGCWGRNRNPAAICHLPWPMVPLPVPVALLAAGVVRGAWSGLGAGSWQGTGQLCVRACVLVLVLRAYLNSDHKGPSAPGKQPAASHRHCPRATTEL